MVNKDMNGFPVKKCSAFQFFKKRVRRWIKSPMVSVDKHQSPSLKYTGPPVVPIPPAEPDSEPPLCRSCLGDHAFQRAALPSEKESCSWETQSGCEVKEPCNHANILTKPDPRTFWTNDDSGSTSAGAAPQPSFCNMQIYEPVNGFLTKLWDFSALLGFGQKHKKGVFGSGSAVHKGHLFVLGPGQEISPGLSHGGSFKETSVFSRRPRRLRARPPLSMGEMQGTLARVRLESLLRPRHKKRAEAQKRSESFLLTGLAFMKQRRMGLNDFIQKIANNSYACKHPEVQSILKISQPQEPELLNANPSPPPSPSQQINLGPSSNPHAKPSDFHFLKVIGKGSFGKVLLARHKAEEAFYAVKVLQKKAILKKKEEKHIMSERNVLLKNVKHPFLVGLHFSFQTADKLYFVLDYINGGELFYHLQRERCFLEPRARFYAAEIASALGYLHSLNIVYRDLKPENILLDSQGHIVLTDFGLCKENIEPNGTTSTFCGTPEYLAPEVLHKQPYDRTVDWWCLGAVLYEMLYGLPPFYSRNTAEMYDNILNKPLQLKPNITNSARHLLEGLLQKDRTKRLGAQDDFMEIKNHVFFSVINWDELINKKITPPFNPNVSGPSDLRHFDPEFTEEPVPSSIGRSPDSILLTASVKEAAEAFLGFSYAPPVDSFL